MEAINLLPKEKRKSKGVSKVKRRLEIILTLFIVVFLILLSSAFGATLFLQDKKSKLEVQYEKVKTEVNALSAAETKTVYLRDRIEKFNKIKGMNEEIEVIDVFDKLTKDFPEDSVLGGVGLTNNELGFDIQIGSIQSLAYFLDLILKSEKYSKVVIKSLRIQDEGYRYTLALDIVGK